jgi:hypothetical protein
MDSSPSEILHAAALARRIGVPAAWLKREADAGRLPCLRAGSRYLFDRRVVERELLRRAAKPQPSDRGGVQP